jgi:hypothetical protein
MVYELRTYQLRPGAVSGYFEFFAANGLAIITKYAEMVGYFRTETGALNRIVHLWRYRDRQHRSEQRAKLIADSQWQTAFLEHGMSLLLDQQSQLLEPLPFSRDPFYGAADHVGAAPRIFEIQRKIIDASVRAAYLEHAAELAPVIEEHVARLAIFAADSGETGELVELFSFRDEADRTARKTALARALTPLLAGKPVALRTERQLLIPAPFSPLR